MQDKTKILRNAEKYVLERKFPQAVAEYQKLLDIDPEEPTLLNTVGDLLIRQGAEQAALSYFHRVAEIYQHGGFALKAIAMFKKILQLAPAESASRESLADLFEKQGLAFDAVRELRELASARVKAGKPDQALLYVRRVVEIDPGNPANWLQKAELQTQAEGFTEAEASILQAVTLLLEKKDSGKAFEVAAAAVQENCSRNLLESYVQAAQAAGRLSAAEAFLQERLDSTGQEFPFQVFQAWILEKKGETEAASELYIQLQQSGYHDPLITDGVVRSGWSQQKNRLMEEEELLDTGLDLLGNLDSTVPAAPAQLPTEPEPDISPFEHTFELETTDNVELRDTREGFGLFSVDDQSSGAFVFDPLEEMTAPPAFPQSEPEEIPAAPALEDVVSTSSLEEALEETDFYLKLGFQDDARQLLEKLLRLHPADERVLARARKVGIAEPTAASVPESAPPQVTDDQAFSAAGFEVEPTQLVQPTELTDDFSDWSPPVSAPAAANGVDGLNEEIEFALNGLFSGVEDSEPEEALRYDVSSQNERGENSPKVHYDLGLAYKEMGLVEDGVLEFLKAFELLQDSGDNPQKILCCSMLANSFLQLERNQEAVEWAEQGLQVPDQKEFERKALEYDLARGCENLGERDQALNLYQDIRQRDPHYRDVRERENRLSGMAG